MFVSITTWARMRGEALRQARLAARLTQEELAWRLGCCRNTVSNAERGYPLSDALAHAWAQATGCVPHFELRRSA